MNGHTTGRNEIQIYVNINNMQPEIVHIVQYGFSFFPLLATFSPYPFGNYKFNKTSHVWQAKWEREANIEEKATPSDLFIFHLFYRVCLRRQSLLSIRPFESHWTFLSSHILFKWMNEAKPSPNHDNFFSRPFSSLILVNFICWQCEIDTVTTNYLLLYCSTCDSKMGSDFFCFATLRQFIDG